MRMRSFCQSVLVVVLAAAVWLAPTAANARRGPGGDFGIGLVVGHKTGLTGQLYLSHNTALDFVLGFETFDDRDFYFHTSFNVYLFQLARSRTLTLPFYIGIGGFIDGDNDNDNGDGHFGMRVPFGLSLDFRRAPFRFFSSSHSDTACSISATITPTVLALTGPLVFAFISSLGVLRLPGTT